MEHDVLISTKIVVEIADFSKSHWHDVQNPRSSRYDPTVPKKVMVSERMVRYWRKEVIAWLEKKRQGAQSDR